MKKRSVPLLHHRQTFFRQNRLFHITRFPASKLTSPYVRQASLLAGYEINNDQILIFPCAKLNARPVTQQAMQTEQMVEAASDACRIQNSRG